MLIEPPIGVRVVRGKTRCHPFISDIQTFYAVTTEALSLRVWPNADRGPRHMVLAARAAHADVGLPLEGYVEAAIDGRTPDETIIRVDAKLPEPTGVNAAGMESISTRIVASVFAVFTERGIDWLRQNRGSDVSAWPQASNFCRIVRNAIVHGGKINIDSPKAVGASWRHLRYDHRHKDRHILHTGDLSIGDLIILMLEMESELNDLEAPFDLG